MPDSALAPALYPAAPAFTVDAEPRPDWVDALKSLVVEEDVLGMRRCEVTLANWGAVDGALGFPYFDARRLDFGMHLQIDVGAGQGGGTVFDGRITAIEGRFVRDRAPEALVLAEDRLQELRMTRRSRTFENVSDADVVRQVAGEHGLQASVDVDGPTHRVLAQLNQSDLAFLRERVRAIDAELWIEGSTLFAQARSRRNASSLSLTYGEGLREFAACADLAGQVSGLTVSGWDVASRSAIRYRATASALAGELGDDTSGSEVLDQSLGTRDQQVVHTLPFTAQEAQGLAEALFRRTARRFVTGTGVAEADARLTVGARVTLGRVGRFDGKYDVTKVRHVFSLETGLQTHFQVERAGLCR
ncbi:MAG: phage late control D family protein [Polyangiaceae bacterium]|nr:phage late control D family protein [Polyangiaceae bacterium]